MRRVFCHGFFFVLVLSFELLFRANATDYTIPGTHPTLSDALTVVIPGDRIILTADLQNLYLSDSFCPQGLEGSLIEIVAALDTTITIRSAYIFRCNWYHIHHGEGHLIFEHSVDDDLIRMDDSYIHLGPLEFQEQGNGGHPLILCNGGGGVLLQGLDIYGTGVGIVRMRCSGRIVPGRASVIRDSVFRGMDYGALDIEIGGYSLIERNYFVGSPRYAFLWLDDTNNLVRNNIFEITTTDQSLQAGMITLVDDSASVEIRNNLLVCMGDDTSPFYVWLDDFSTPPLQSINFVNNVVKGPCSNGSVFGGRAKTDSSILADGSVRFLHLSDWDGISTLYDLDPGDSYDLTVSDVTFGEVSLAETGTKPDPWFRYDGRIDLIGEDSVVFDDFAGDLRVGPTTSIGPFQFFQCPVVINADPNDECLSCRGGWDWSDSCDSCVAGRDEYGALKDCGSCLLENADPMHPTCGACLPHFDWDSSCTVCEENWDFESGCTECVSGFRWNEEKQVCEEIPGIGVPGLGDTLGVVFGTILGVGFFVAAAVVVVVLAVILVVRAKRKSKDLELRPATVPPHKHSPGLSSSTKICSTSSNRKDFRTQEVDDGKAVSAPPLEYTQRMPMGVAIQDTRTSKASAPDYY